MYKCRCSPSKGALVMDDKNGLARISSRKKGTGDSWVEWISLQEGQSRARGRCPRRRLASAGELPVHREGRRGPRSGASEDPGIRRKPRRSRDRLPRAPLGTRFPSVNRPTRDHPDRQGLSHAVRHLLPGRRMHHAPRRDLRPGRGGRCRVRVGDPIQSRAGEPRAGHRHGRCLTIFHPPVAAGRHLAPNSGGS